MREIKFRVWGDGHMYYDISVRYADNRNIANDIRTNDGKFAAFAHKWPVMQFTGLHTKDKPTE